MSYTIGQILLVVLVGAIAFVLMQHFKEQRAKRREAQASDPQKTVSPAEFALTLSIGALFVGPFLIFVVVNSLGLGGFGFGPIIGGGMLGCAVTAFAKAGRVAPGDEHRGMATLARFLATLAALLSLFVISFGTGVSYH